MAATRPSSKATRCCAREIRVTDHRGKPLCLVPAHVYPVVRILRRRDGTLWSEIRIAPTYEPLVIAEHPKRLSNRIGKALRRMQ